MNQHYHLLSTNKPPQRRQRSRVSKNSKKNRKTIKVLENAWKAEPWECPEHWEDGYPVSYEALIGALTREGWWIPGQGLIPVRRAQEILEEDYCGF